MSISNKRVIPGPHSKRLARRLRQVECANTTYLSERFPVFWKSAKGSTVTDVDGHTFLDLTSAFAVASLGHANTSVQHALVKQSKKIWHGMGDVHPNEVKVDLLEALTRTVPRGLKRTILSNSGAEAVESALKTARLATGKPGIIAFDSAYHGLSYGTLTVTQRPDFTHPFADQTMSLAVHCTYPDTLRGVSVEQSLEVVERFLKNGGQTLAGPVGAILVEPVQGRGGVRVPGPGFLKGLKALAKEYGLVLIADEVMTGFGRTGKAFGVDHEGVLPDVMCVGKALANGFPISACIGTERVMQAWPPSDGEAIHTSTFLGNPLGCAMAIASIEEFKKKKLAKRSHALGGWWKKELQDALMNHPRVAEVRGRGLMVGIELVEDRQTLVPASAWTGRVVTEALQQGLLLLSGGKHRNVLTLTPPLTIRGDELAQATQTLKEVLYATV